MRLCRLLVLIVIGFAGYFVLQCAPTTVVLAADTYQPLSVKTGLWNVTVTNDLGGAPHTSSYRTCVTDKDLHTNPWGKGPDEKCDWNVLKSTSSDMEVHGSSCEAGKEYGMQTEVDLKIHALDSSNVKATMQGTSKGNGQTMNFKGNFTGKWAAATCPAGVN